MTLIDSTVRSAGASRFGAGRGRHPRTSLAAVFLASLLGPACLNAEALPAVEEGLRSSVLGDAQVAAIDACVMSSLDAGGVPGGALALMIDGELALERQYGVASTATGEAVTVDTLFRPGSVQKMMTALAVLLRSEAGDLDLAAPVRSQVPELGFAGPWSTDAITIEHLLTHASGIPDMSETLCSESLSEWAAALGSVPLFAPAGSFFNYTNAGYSLAGLVAERAGGQPFSDLMLDTVWRPGGLLHTVQTAAEAQELGPVSWGHEIDPESGVLQPFPPDTFECPWAGPSGDFFTTAADLARFAHLLMAAGDGVWSSQVIERLLAPRISVQDEPGEEYGYGVFRRELNGEVVYYHAGGVPGGSSHLLWVPERGLAVAVVGNRSALLEPAAHCVREVMTGEVWPEPEGPSAVRSWRRFRGLYWIRTVDGDSLPAIVWMRAGALRFSLPDLETGQILTLEALPVGGDRFWFDLDGDGEANGLEIVSFVEGSTAHGPGWRPQIWLRNRLYVGWRLVPAFTRHESAAESLVKAFGQAP